MFTGATRKLRAFLSLSNQDRWLLLQAWWLLLGVDLGLRLLPFRRLQSLLANHAPTAATAQWAGAAALIGRLHWLVRLAGRNHLYPMTCLRRALALQRLLALHGVPAELRFGVQKENGGLTAHAWLEYQGLPIGEPEVLTGRYAPLAYQSAARHA